MAASQVDEDPQQASLTQAVAQTVEVISPAVCYTFTKSVMNVFSQLIVRRMCVFSLIASQSAKRPPHPHSGCTSGFAVHDQDQGRRAGSARRCIAGETEGCHTCVYVCVEWRVVGLSDCCLL